MYLKHFKNTQKQNVSNWIGVPPQLVKMIDDDDKTKTTRILNSIYTCFKKYIFLAGKFDLNVRLGNTGTRKYIHFKNIFFYT